MSRISTYLVIAVVTSLSCSAFAAGARSASGPRGSGSVLAEPAKLPTFNPAAGRAVKPNGTISNAEAILNGKPVPATPSGVNPGLPTGGSNAPQCATVVNPAAVADGIKYDEPTVKGLIKDGYLNGKPTKCKDPIGEIKPDSSKERVVEVAVRARQKCGGGKAPSAPGATTTCFLNAATDMGVKDPEGALAYIEANCDYY